MLSSWFKGKEPPKVNYEMELQINGLLDAVKERNKIIQELQEDTKTQRDPRFTRVPVRLTMPMRQAMLAYIGKRTQAKLRIDVDILYRDLLTAWTSSLKDDAEHSKPQSPPVTEA